MGKCSTNEVKCSRALKRTGSRLSAIGQPIREWTGTCVDFGDETYPNTSFSGMDSGRCFPCSFKSALVILVKNLFQKLLIMYIYFTNNCRTVLIHPFIRRQVK